MRRIYSLTIQRNSVSFTKSMAQPGFWMNSFWLQNSDARVPFCPTFPVLLQDTELYRWHPHLQAPDSTFAPILRPPKLDQGSALIQNCNCWLYTHRWATLDRIKPHKSLPTSPTLSLHSNENNGDHSPLIKVDSVHLVPLCSISLPFPINPPQGGPEHLMVKSTDVLTKGHNSPS